MPPGSNEQPPVDQVPHLMCRAFLGSIRKHLVRLQSHYTNGLDRYDIWSDMCEAQGCGIQCGGGTREMPALQSEWRSSGLTTDMQTLSLPTQPAALRFTNSFPPSAVVSGGRGRQTTLQHAAADAPPATADLPGPTQVPGLTCRAVQQPYG